MLPMPLYLPDAAITVKIQCSPFIMSLALEVVKQCTSHFILIFVQIHNTNCYLLSLPYFLIVAQDYKGGNISSGGSGLETAFPPLDQTLWSPEKVLWKPLFFAFNTVVISQ